VYKSAFGVLDSAGTNINKTGDLVAKAYDNAQGQGDQKTALMFAALAVIALAAFQRIKL
jgi:hypothetical protein